ncbi:MULTISPECIES: prepilin-type N-terminal cleavage/methylation domain-containing protein [unclassified Exiguobacterium]|uniref:prepilin-type N-terminal cleavage/methylation domain-containing protein n=1 Tax=unclassified Exiguobacterium TaxID=2644629 RepID=UPI001BE9B7CA|nr:MULTISPECIES: prepilin-type N-terminal cleavage/methylation domain-containing protein [unclassified Exiguobacterium]MDT0191031.1 prepilin-type N-terminal cleavage/methylation domain-containing protein [Exiguobacterium sp. BG5(2022)]
MVEKLKMIWQDAKQLKDERGLTLVELLVVVVILGIIAAIAVVAIGGIIENSKEDALKSDAKQMVSAAKLYVASNDVANGTVLVFAGTPDATATPKDVDTSSYIETLKDPYGSSGYSAAGVKVAKGADGNYSYSVYIDGEKNLGTKAAPVAETAISSASL